MASALRREARPMFLVAQFFFVDFVCEIIDLFWWLK
jgi:hypothetical protein